MDSAIHRINHNPVDSVIDFRNTYPLDRSDRCSTVRYIYVEMYDQTPHNEIYSPVCNSGMIEDEFHFLLHCPKYSIPREKFYNQIQHNFVDFNQLSSTELLIKLMNSQNFSLNSHLLKFVSLCNDFVIICYQITLMTLDWPVLIVTLS